MDGADMNFENGNSKDLMTIVDNKLKFGGKSGEASTKWKVYKMPAIPSDVSSST